MVSPFSMDVTVGESIVLPCQVSHDHSLDIVFTWSFNGHLIDFEKDGDHFERVGGVSIKPDQVGDVEKVTDRRKEEKGGKKWKFFSRGRKLGRVLHGALREVLESNKSQA